MKKFKDLKEKINNDNQFINNTDYLKTLLDDYKDISATSKDCYAKKSSNIYVDSCLYNLAAEINFKKLSAEKIISDIEEVINSSDSDIKFIRFNEAGDFINYDLFKKANNIDSEDIVDVLDVFFDLFDEEELDVEGCNDVCEYLFKHYDLFNCVDFRSFVRF